MGNWVKTQQPCPCGKSSDAYSVDESGNGYCFGKCGGKFFKNNHDIEEDKSDFTAEYFPHRGLSKATLEKYGTLTKLFNGTPVETGFYYPNGAIKIRSIPVRVSRPRVNGNLLSLARMFSIRVVRK